MSIFRPEVGNVGFGGDKAQDRQIKERIAGGARYEAESLIPRANAEKETFAPRTDKEAATERVQKNVEDILKDMVKLREMLAEQEKRLEHIRMELKGAFDPQI